MSPPDLDLGFYVVGLTTRPQDWIARRVETLEFLGEDQTRRRISFDVDVDFAWDRWPRADTEEELIPLPLGQLSKRPLALLDMRDASGSSLPILGRYQNGHIAWSALVAHALLVLGQADPQALPHGLVESLRTVAFDSPLAAFEAVDSLRHNPDSQLRTLVADLAFSKQVQDLASNFLLVTLAPATDLGRRIFKFAYAYQASAERLFSTSTLAVARGRFAVPIPSLGEADSYHVQLVPPPGLEVESCSLTLKLPFATNGNIIQGSHAGGQGHVQASKCPPGTSGEAVFLLRAPARGMLLALLVASATVSVMLGLVWRNPAPIGSLAGNTDAVAIILLVPSLFATYLALPGEPSIVSRVMGTARSLVLLSSACAFTLATGVVAGLGNSSLGSLAGGAFCLSLLSVVGLTASATLALFRKT